METLSFTFKATQFDIYFFSFFLESSIQWSSFMNFVNTQHFQKNFCQNNLSLKKNCNKVGHISAKCESALKFQWLIIKDDG